MAADKGFDIFSHKYSQSSTFGTSLAADQDSVNELNGRFTALQMVGEEIKEESVKQTSVLEVIAGVLAGGNKSIDNLPDISAEGRAIAIEGYESRINVVFPKNEFANIVNGINDVKVISVEGRLTDHYNPETHTVNLSQDVYYSNSIAAAAVAAHECGHAVQHARAYSFLTMRSK